MYLDQYKKDILSLCKTHKVKSLYVFGSILTNQFGPDSDIDFVVDIQAYDPIEYAENYFEFKFKLQDLLKKPVDLLEQRGLRNSYLIENINNSKQLVYEA